MAQGSGVGAAHKQLIIKAGPAWPEYFHAREISIGGSPTKLKVAYRGCCHSLLLGEIADSGTLQATCIHVRWKEAMVYPSAMTYAMDCAAGASNERRARIEREARAGNAGPSGFPIPEVCTAWGVPEVPASERGLVLLCYK